MAMIERTAPRPRLGQPPLPLAQPRPRDPNPDPTEFASGGPSPRQRSSALRPLRSNRQQRHQLPRNLRGRFWLLSGRRSGCGGFKGVAGLLGLVWGVGLTGLSPSGLGAAALGEPPVPPPGILNFGRWERRVGHCQWQSEPDGGGRRRCGLLQLVQPEPGLLVVRLIATVRGNPIASDQLTLAGELTPPSRPMRCRDNRCTPHWPLQMRISAVRWQGAEADAEPGSSVLPLGTVAEGDCILGPRTLSCVATSRDGRHWSAAARL